MDLIACSEIGSARFIYESVELDNNYFICTNEVEKFFTSVNKDNQKFLDFEDLKDLIKPDTIHLGTTLGNSIELKVFNNFFKNSYIISYIDSIWNIENRFLNPISTKQQIFPNEIIVPSMEIKKEVVERSLAKKVTVKESSNFSRRRPIVSEKEKTKIREKFNIHKNTKTLIFISEYVQEIPSEWKILPQQSSKYEIENSLDLFSKGVEYFRKKNIPINAIILGHPSKKDKDLLKSIEFEILRSIEKEELTAIGDIFFGINSSLLIYLSNIGKSTGSFCLEEKSNSGKLPYFYKNISSIKNIDDFIKLAK